MASRKPGSVSGKSYRNIRECRKPDGGYQPGLVALSDIGDCGNNAFRP
jgi:hypothetical protein